MQETESSTPFARIFHRYYDVRAKIGLKKSQAVRTSQEWQEKEMQMFRSAMAFG